MNYLVATTKNWNIEAFGTFTPNFPGVWYLISTPEQLTSTLLNELKPAYIFFPHWSWKVPEDITANYKCVCFHMTDLPYGRGGSPLQNLIKQGITQTQLTALQMNEELDSGPIYTKHPLELSGTAQQIFERAAHLIYHLIKRIITENIEPKPQLGQPVFFQRRSPQQSLLPLHLSTEELYDFIRMLDAETYPHAYIEYDKWRLEFTNAESVFEGEIIATVRFSLAKGAPL